MAQIMTPLGDVYMVHYDAILNFDTVSEMLRQGKKNSEGLYII